ncbi:hypothetical protein VIGAN_08290400, partial [Vigna angularis var. angularis]
KERKGEKGEELKIDSQSFLSVLQRILNQLLQPFKLHARASILHSDRSISWACFLWSDDPSGKWHKVQLLFISLALVKP